MKIKWTTSAKNDVVRLRAFLATQDEAAANRVIREFLSRAQDLRLFPELGNRLESFGARDVRKLLIGDYELRYERTDKAIVVLRVWHAREDR